MQYCELALHLTDLGLMSGLHEQVQVSVHLYQWTQARYNPFLYNIHAEAMSIELGGSIRAMGLLTAYWNVIAGGGGRDT